MKKILYLYRQIMPYNIPVLKELTKKGFEITVICKISKKQTPYDPPDLNKVTFIDESFYDIDQLQTFSENYNPDLIFICDWSIRKFNRCGLFARKKLDIPVIVGCDTQWRRGRQWLNVLTSKFRQQRYFSYILVAGVRQYEYAKKIGFKNDQILMNLLSADTEKFKQVQLDTDKFKENRNFLYAGRFVSVKGIKQLIEAWSQINKKKGATLTLAGTGPLKDQMKFPDDVIIHPFLNQDQLLDIAKKSCCFVLPSIFEPWALVIHEFAAAGLPLIVTSACGATPHFVINNYNGFVVSPGSIAELRIAMERILSLDAETLYEFSKRSRMMSMHINPEIAANSLLSVLPQHN